MLPVRRLENVLYDGDMFANGSPTRYTHGGIECIDAISAALTEDEFRGYLKGNIIKYVWRERFKGGSDDIRKAMDYAGWLFKKLDDGDEDVSDSDCRPRIATDFDGKVLTHLYDSIGREVHIGDKFVVNQSNVIARHVLAAGANFVLDKQCNIFYPDEISIVD